MAKYGLNSGTAAPLVIGRRALNLSEKIPKCLLRPEDVNKHDWSHWRRVASWGKSSEAVTRGNLEMKPSLYINFISITFY